MNAPRGPYTIGAVADGAEGAGAMAGARRGTRRAAVSLGGDEGYPLTGVIVRCNSRFQGG